MNNIIYQWLYNDNKNNYKKSTTLIQCILILSINNMIIEYDNIIQYYNNIIQYQQKKDIGHNNEEITTLLKGLNQQQFQIIHNNINLLKQLHNNTTSTIEGIYIPKESTPILSNIDDEDYDEINKTKFEYSIFLITQNNKLTIKQQNNNNNTKLPIPKFNQTLQIIDSRNNNNNNCNCGNSNGTSSLFIKKIWRNKVIKRQILNHIRLYNIHSKYQLRLTKSELSTYKFKDYINDLILEIEDYGCIDSNSLPSNLRKLTLLPPTSTANHYLILKPYALPDSLTTVEFQYINIVNEILSGDHLFPNSIKNLKFIGLKEFSIKETISKSWLPNSLKSLEIKRRNDSFQQTIGKLPESLTELILNENYKGTIEAGAIPSSVKNYFKFNSNGNSNILDENSIPRTTVNLEFDTESDQNLKVGVIPNNVKSIKFQRSRFIDIGVNTLPLSLVSITFKQGYYNAIGANVLPLNLTYIEITEYNRPLTPNIFPLSIKTIKLDSFNQPIPVRYFVNHVNLTTLNFPKFVHEIPPQSLPPSLTSLKILHFNNQKSTSNIFPQSLLELELRNQKGNSQYNPGVLPTSITSLSIYLNEEYPLVTGSLPCNLKELHLLENDLDQDLSVDGILPDSLETIYISRKNLDYNIINKLDTGFILKYIKFS